MAVFDKIHCPCLTLSILDTDKQVYWKTNSEDPDEMSLKGGDSSGSALFAKIKTTNLHSRNVS